jgi:large subunit ribosomal protein L21
MERIKPSISEEIGNKQHLVEEGNVLAVDLIHEKAKPEFKVLALIDGDKVELGQPYLESKLKLEIVESLVKGKKLEIIKLKPKKRY